MNFKRIIAFCFFIQAFFNGFAQSSYGDAQDAQKLCLAMQGTNSFRSDNDADVALNKILSVVGLAKRFVLQPCLGIENALAISYMGNRYILYDKDFMSAIANNSNDWSSLTILAHEVGHHVNAHSLDVLLYATEVIEKQSLYEKRQQELEADEFAGFVMAKLGASLNQVSEAIAIVSSEEDDSGSTHPSRSKRIRAITEGFNNGSDNNVVSEIYRTPLSFTAEDYFYRGIDKMDDDNYGAIADLTKTIDLDPKFPNAYFVRGLLKQELEDYQEAIGDYSMALKINPNHEDAYYGRGICKSSVDNHYGAITDLTKVLDLNPNSELAFFFRGYSNLKTKDYSSAISDFTRLINLNPSYKDVFYYRGLAKANLNGSSSGDVYGACDDMRKAASLGNADERSFVNDICNGSYSSNQTVSSKSSSSSSSYDPYIIRRMGDRKRNIGIGFGGGASDMAESFGDNLTFNTFSFDFYYHFLSIGTRYVLYEETADWQGTLGIKLINNFYLKGGIGSRSVWHHPDYLDLTSEVDVMSTSAGLTYFIKLRHFAIVPEAVYNFENENYVVVLSLMF
jgi:tetratricopeptide (TPR) repeat protein